MNQPLYRVIVETREGGTKKFENVVEYDHRDGGIRMTMKDGSLKEVGPDEVKTSRVEEMPVNESGPMQEMNEGSGQ